MNRIAIALIRLYQLSLGRVMPGRCRFYPTCSAYALECFERFPFFQAFAKTAYRIGRCTPFSTGYFDPVVPEGESAISGSGRTEPAKVDNRNCNHNH
ncbi:MAG: membrane protein insertion efficiency factor YidD [bacterium]|nr:membrane protein insertion efficiency factor YidD [bacterium]